MGRAAKPASAAGCAFAAFALLFFGAASFAAGAAAAFFFVRFGDAGVEGTCAGGGAAAAARALRGLRRRLRREGVAACEAGREELHALLASSEESSSVSEVIASERPSADRLGAAGLRERGLDAA